MKNLNFNVPCGEAFFFKYLYSIEELEPQIVLGINEDLYASDSSSSCSHSSSPSNVPTPRYTNTMKRPTVHSPEPSSPKPHTSSSSQEEDETESVTNKSRPSPKDTDSITDSIANWLRVRRVKKEVYYK